MEGLGEGAGRCEVGGRGSGGGAAAGGEGLLERAIVMEKVRMREDGGAHKTQMTVFGGDVGVWPFALAMLFRFCFASCGAMI